MSSSSCPLILSLSLALSLSTLACTSQEKPAFEDPIQAIQNAQLMRDALNKKDRIPEPVRYQAWQPDTDVVSMPIAKYQDANPKDFQIDAESGRIRFHAEVVYFAFDTADLTSEGKAQLDSLATFMKEHPETELQIAGHCDERGTRDYNLALGQKRSLAVKSYLASHAIPDARLAALTFGKERPIEAGNGEETWARNRRVEFAFRTSLAH